MSSRPCSGGSSTGPARCGRLPRGLPPACRPCRAAVQVSSPRGCPMSSWSTGCSTSTHPEPRRTERTMDLSKRATAWVTAAIKENEFLHDMTGVMSDYMDVEDTKFAVHLAMKFVPKLVGLVSPELGEALELIDDAIDLAQLGDLVDSIVDNAIEFVALTLDDSGPPEGSMERELMDILYATLEDRPELS